MKKRFFYAALVFSFGLIFQTGCKTAQTAAEKKTKAAEIGQKINDFEFTFKATHAYPTGYRAIYMSPYYYLKVSKDAVTAYLPYYGRAYTAPMDPAQGGIKFTSTDFEYEVSKGNERERQVRIKTHDTDREIILFLDIWENGSTRLDVTDPNRQPISFQEISKWDKNFPRIFSRSRKIFCAVEGLEPPRFRHQILSLARLPITPQPQIENKDNTFSPIFDFSFFQVELTSQFICSSLSRRILCKPFAIFLLPADNIHIPAYTR